MRTHPHPTHSRRAALEDGHDLQLRCLIELRSFPEVLPELLQQISAQSDCDFRKCRLHDEGHLCGSVVLQKKPRLGKGHSQSDLTNCDQRQLRKLGHTRTGSGENAILRGTPAFATFAQAQENHPAGVGHVVARRASRAECA